MAKGKGVYGGLMLRLRGRADRVPSVGRVFFQVKGKFGIQQSSWSSPAISLVTPYSNRIPPRAPPPSFSPGGELLTTRARSQQILRA